MLLYVILTKSFMLQAQAMEQKLQNLGISSDNFKDCVSNADQACKDQIISNLEQQVEEQVCW